MAARQWQVLGIVEAAPNELLYTNPVTRRVYRYQFDESLLLGQPNVVGQAQLLRVNISIVGRNNINEEMDAGDLIRSVQTYLATFAYRRFAVHARIFRTVPLQTPVVDAIEVIGRHMSDDNSWHTYRFNIPALHLADFIPVGSAHVPLHDLLTRAYAQFSDALNATGSDPDALEILNLRAIQLRVRYTILPQDVNVPLALHTVNVNPLMGVVAPALRYTNVIQTRGRVPEAHVIAVFPQTRLNNPFVGALTPYIPLGGCKSYVQDILDASVVGRHRPDESIPELKRRRGNSMGVQLDLNNMRVWCPNVKNNNCFFACVKHSVALDAIRDGTELQSPAAVERIDTWRRRMGIPMNKMISFREISEFVMKIYQHPIQVFDEHHVLMAEFQPPQHQPHLPPFQFLLFREHFFVIIDDSVQRFACDKCGRRNLRQMEGHKCASNRQKFLQLKVKKVVQHVDPLKDQFLPASAEQLSTMERWPNIVFFDFETFFDGAGHRVYAVGFLHWDENGEERYSSFYGEPALENFVMFLENEHKRGQLLTLVSYNGSGFDHYFILEEFLKQLETPDEFVLSRGRLLQVSVWGHKCLDLYNFLGPASLDSNCAAYQVPVRKHVFPHLYPHSFADVEYKGPVLEEEFYPEKMREDMKKWKDTLEESYVFDFEKEAEFYLQRDVECLMELGKRFMKSVWEEFSVYLPNYLTLSQMAFDLWCKSLDPQWVLPLPIESAFYGAINAATYGGRCHFVKRFFRSSQPDTTPYADLDDYLVDLDVVSLYPSSMQGKVFPIGKYEHWKDERSVATWKEMFEFGTSLPLAIWKVSVIPPRHLIVSALPKKHDDKLTTCWENTPSESQWYTSVDLQIGQQYGYEFKFHEGYVWEQSAPVFDAYIQTMFERKSQQDDFKKSKDARYNPAARDVYKRLMNALYGKMMQKRQSTAHMFLESGPTSDEAQAAWIDFLEDHIGVEYKEMGDMILVTGEKVDFSAGISKPHYLGAFVLSYSRQIMNEYFDLLDPLRKLPHEGTWLDSMENSFFYTDTDSLIVHEKHIPKVQHKLGSSLGLLSDELNGGKIIEGYFLSPKLYCVRYMLPDGTIHEKLRGKGIPNSMLTLDQFKSMLMDNAPVKYEFTQLRKVQADLNAKQEQQGVRPFSIVSILNASRTLNREGTYAEAGLLGGRMVLNDVSLSLPVGFEKYHDDIDDLWAALLEEDNTEAAALDQALRESTKRPDREYVDMMNDPGSYSPMAALFQDRWETAADAAGVPHDEIDNVLDAYFS